MSNKNSDNFYDLPIIAIVCDEVDVCDLVRSAREYVSHGCNEQALVLYRKAASLMPDLQQTISSEIKELLNESNKLNHKGI